MICKNCGKEIADNSLFCSECGNPVNTQSESVENRPSVHGQQQAQPMSYCEQSYTPYNGMAIAGFVLSFFFRILGIIFSAVALSQIKENNQRGHGLALAGLIISIVIIAVEVLVSLLVICGGLAVGSHFIL